MRKTFCFPLPWTVEFDHRGRKMIGLQPRAVRDRQAVDNLENLRHRLGPAGHPRPDHLSLRIAQQRPQFQAPAHFPDFIQQHDAGAPARRRFTPQLLDDFSFLGLLHFQVDLRQAGNVRHSDLLFPARGLAAVNEAAVVSIHLHQRIAFPDAERHAMPVPAAPGSIPIHRPAAPRTAATGSAAPRAAPQTGGHKTTAARQAPRG